MSYLVDLMTRMAARNPEFPAQVAAAWRDMERDMDQEFARLEREWEAEDAELEREWEAEAGARAGQGEE
jgi:hypothetical protein